MYLFCDFKQNGNARSKIKYSALKAILYQNHRNFYGFYFFKVKAYRSILIKSPDYRMHWQRLIFKTLSMKSG